jgi:hypothetical protein
MEEVSQLVRNSSLYKEFLAERAEILRHKWIESERAGYDIGFERALMDWIVRYRSAWYQQRRICLQKGAGGTMANGSSGTANALSVVRLTPDYGEQAANRHEDRDKPRIYADKGESEIRE